LSLSVFGYQLLVISGGKKQGRRNGINAEFAEEKRGGRGEFVGDGHGWRQESQLSGRAKTHPHTTRVGHPETLFERVENEQTGLDEFRFDNADGVEQFSVYQLLVISGGKNEEEKTELTRSSLRKSVKGAESLSVMATVGSQESQLSGRGRTHSESS